MKKQQRFILKSMILQLLLLNVAFSNTPCSASNDLYNIRLNNYGAALGSFMIHLGPTKKLISDRKGPREKVFYNCAEAGLPGDFGSCTEFTVYPISAYMINEDPRGKKIEKLMDSPGTVRIIISKADSNHFVRYAYTTDHYNSYCSHSGNILKLKP